MFGFEGEGAKALIPTGFSSFEGFRRPEVTGPRFSRPAYETSREETAGGRAEGRRERPAYGDLIRLSLFNCLRIVNVDGQFHYCRIPSPHMANEAPE